MDSVQAFRSRIEIAFTGSRYIEINSNRILYVFIDHEYETDTIPKIYVSVAVDIDTYNIILDEIKSAKIYLRIQRYNALSSTPIYKDYIKEQFTYFIPSTTEEYSKQLADANANIDSNFKVMNLGLMSMDMMNDIREQFGGNTLKNIDQHSLVYNAIEGTKIVMKTPIYNKKYTSIYIPPISSRKEMLEFIFNKDPFYDSQFLYFMDFDTSYLLDRSGESIDANNGQLNTIILDVRSVTEREAYQEGMTIESNGYFLYINPANTNISTDTGSEKVANQLVASDRSTGTVVMDLNINNNVESSTKQRYVRLEEPSAVIYKNNMESSQITIDMFKESIDAKYITPNKSIILNNYEGYKQYNGNYVLVNKKEVFKGSAGEFSSVTSFRIRKVGNIQKIGSAATKATGTKKTWSSAPNTGYSVSNKISKSSKGTRTSKR